MENSSLPKPQTFNEHSASLPWEGVLSLSAYWGGAGSLFDWITPDDWDIERAWSRDVVLARMADAILSYIEKNHSRSLPKHPAQWLDLISQHSFRLVEQSDVPSAHTDWVATLSAFGKYPSESYIERKPAVTYDSAFTRTLKWTCRSVLDADKLIRSKFSRSSQASRLLRAALSALSLPEVTAAASEQVPSETDLLACQDAGGAWLVISRIATLLSALRAGSARAQLIGLRPILPQYAHQLFELGVFGMISHGARSLPGRQIWKCTSPIAAGAAGSATLEMTTDEYSWNAFYQSSPSQTATLDRPYKSLASAYNGKALRPDIWIVVKKNDLELEIIVECKYSLDPAYVLTGIPQVFSYNVEYPKLYDARRLSIVVGPEEVIDETSIWRDQFILTSPSGAKEVVQETIKAFLLS